MWQVVQYIFVGMASLVILVFLASIVVGIVDLISGAMSDRGTARRQDAAVRAWQVQQVRQQADQRLHQATRQAMEDMVDAVRKTGGWPT